ncbi:MAG TPA: hypothetical protein PLC24_12350 [Myxococcota bacterium]|nr:hypothetical protein [Myxococcota bacterium]HPV05344.1 hypothetical protein [Myxococcota bacterium]
MTETAGHWFERHLHRALLLVVLAMVSTVSSCYFPPNPLPITLEKARAVISQNVVSQASSLDAGLKFMEGMALFRRVGGYLGGGLGCTIPAEGVGLPTEPDCEFEMGQDHFELGIEESARRLVELVNEFVLVESQIARFSNTNIEIRLLPDVFCRIFDEAGGDSGWDDGGEAGEGAMNTRDVDIGGDGDGGEFAQACRDFLEVVPVQLNLSAYYADSVDIDVQVGEYRVLAFQFRTYGDMTSVSVDMYQLKSALDTANALYGLKGRPMYDSLDASGWISVCLSNDYYGTSQVGLSISDNTAARMSVEGDVFSFDSGEVIATLSADSAGTTGTLSIDAGSVQVEFPYAILIDWLWDLSDGSGEPEALEEPPDVAGKAHVSCDGFELHARTIGDIGVAIEQLGLKDGVLQVRHDFDTLLGIRMLPSSIQSIQAMIGTTDDLNPSMIVNSGAGILLDWNLHEMASDLRTVPAGTADETWYVQMLGNSPEFAVLSGTANQWIRVAAGELSVSSNGIPGPGITIPAGMCARIVEPAEGVHVLMGSIVSEACVQPETSGY